MSFWRFYDNVNPFYSEIRTLKKTESLGTTKAREQKPGTRGQTLNVIHKHYADRSVSE